MKICLMLEGSYPHVTGGVSTWAHMLIKNMPEHQFTVFSIGAEEKYRGAFKYELPPNVTSVKEMFLDEMLKVKGNYGMKYRLTSEMVINLKKLITGEKVCWDHIFKALHENRIKNEMDFFMSINFFDIIRDAYEEGYSGVPFTEFFWTVRSMLVPLFFLLANRMPKADVYHSAATGYAGIFGAMAKYLYKKPFIVTEHGIYSREREEEIIKSGWAKDNFKDMWIKFFYNVCGGAYEYADNVFTLFEKNMQIEIELGCPPQKLEIVPNGIDISSFKDPFDIENITGSNGAETGKPGEGPWKDSAASVDGEDVTVATVTRVVPIKDIKTMLASFNMVKRQVPGAKFLILGPTDEDQQYYDECRRLISRLGLRDVTFTGKVDVKKYLRQIDIMVLTSISEGQPFAILEGMAAAKPFVSTDVGGCRELLYGRQPDEFGNAGIVVPVMDTEKISEAIIRLAGNPLLRRKMGLAGQARVSSFYTSEKCIESYREIYSRFDKQIVLRKASVGRNRV